jgi:hypothetical protein
MGLRKREISVLVTLLAFSSLFIVPLSMPIFSNIVVMMVDDAAVETAAETVKTNAPDTFVVKKDSLEYSLTISRAAGAVVWISHGSEEGIESASSVYSWEKMGALVKKLPGKDLILACESERLYEHHSSHDLLALGGRIDAELGGLVSAWILTGEWKTLGKVMSRATELMVDPTLMDELYWGPNEQFWTGIDAGIWLVSSLCTTFALWRATLNPYSATQIFAGLMVMFTEIIKFASAIVGFLSGTMSAWTLFTKFGGLLAAVLWGIFRSAPWWVQVIASVEFGISVTTGVRVVAALLGLLGMVTLITGVLGDQADPDDVYGRLSFGF